MVCRGRNASHSIIKTVRNVQRPVSPKTNRRLRFFFVLKLTVELKKNHVNKYRRQKINRGRRFIFGEVGLLS